MHKLKYVKQKPLKYTETVKCKKQHKTAGNEKMAKFEVE
jgi:hypothetical protein